MEVGISLSQPVTLVVWLRERDVTDPRECRALTHEAASPARRWSSPTTTGLPVFDSVSLRGAGNRKDQSKQNMMSFLSFYVRLS